MSTLGSLEIYKTIASIISGEPESEINGPLDMFFSIDIQGEYAIVSPHVGNYAALMNVARIPEKVHNSIFISEATFVHLESGKVVMRTLPAPKVVICDEIVYNYDINTTTGEVFPPLNYMIEKFTLSRVMPEIEGETVYVWKHGGETAFSVKNLINGERHRKSGCWLTKELYDSLGGPDPEFLFPPQSGDDGMGIAYVFKVTEPSLIRFSDLPVGKGYVTFICAIDCDGFVVCPQDPRFMWPEFSLDYFSNNWIRGGERDGANEVCSTNERVNLEEALDAARGTEFENDLKDALDEAKFKEMSDSFLQMREYIEKIENDVYYPYPVPTKSSRRLPERGGCGVNIITGGKAPLLEIPTTFTFEETIEAHKYGFLTPFRSNMLNLKHSMRGGVVYFEFVVNGILVYVKFMHRIRMNSQMTVGFNHNIKHRLCEIRTLATNEALNPVKTTVFFNEAYEAQRVAPKCNVQSRKFEKPLEGTKIVPAQLFNYNNLFSENGNGEVVEMSYKQVEALAGRIEDKLDILLSEGNFILQNDKHCSSIYSYVRDLFTSAALKYISRLGWAVQPQAIRLLLNVIRGERELRKFISSTVLSLPSTGLKFRTNREVECFKLIEFIKDRPQFLTSSHRVNRSGMILARIVATVYNNFSTETSHKQRILQELACEPGENIYTLINVISK